MKEIRLTQGKVALVDDDNFERLNAHKWHYKGGYAVRSKSCPRGMIYMHRSIMDAKHRQEIDHIDGDPLNNQKLNLRFCSHSENMANGHGRGGSSRFRGVCWHKGAKKWCSEIRVNYKKSYLGLFDSEEEAAMAYNEAAREHFGDFARLNVLEV